MDVLREYLWLWVICGVFLLTMVIIFIFLLINQWISRRGKHRISKLQRGTLSFVEGNNYQERSPSSVTPPLPPRTQFLSEGLTLMDHMMRHFPKNPPTLFFFF